MKLGKNEGVEKYNKVDTHPMVDSPGEGKQGEVGAHGTKFNGYAGEEGEQKRGKEQHETWV